MSQPPSPFSAPRQGRSGGSDRLPPPGELPQVVHIPDTVEFSDDDAIALEARIRVLEVGARQMVHQGHGDLDLLTERYFPGSEAWMALRGSAIALHPVYHAGRLTRLGAGVDVARVLERPIVDDQTPLEILSSRFGPARARDLAGRVQGFAEQRINADLASLIRGSLDARAVRTRATAAAMIAARHLRGQSRPARMMSLGCGTASPARTVHQHLAAAGVPVGAITLVDRDAVALAWAREVLGDLDPTMTRSFVAADVVDLEAGRPTDLSQLFGAWSTDVIEMMTLFDYLPPAVGIEVLAQVRRLLRPGGLLMLGNMLSVRPQQTFFDRVVRWPSLYQRSVDDTLDLCEAAGFDLDRATTVVPAEGVYAVIGLPV